MKFLTKVLADLEMGCMVSLLWANSAQHRFYLEINISFTTLGQLYYKLDYMAVFLLFTVIWSP